MAADVGDEAAIAAVVALHRERHGRLDVLVNNAGIGVGAAAGEHATKFVDLQLAVNLRSIVLFYREALDLLRVAGAEHRRAQVVNLASIAGKSPQPWLSVYSATKARRDRLHRGDEQGAECRRDQIGCAVPRVRRHRHDRVRQARSRPEQMIRPDDISAAVRFVLSLSPTAVVPEIVFQRSGESRSSAGPPDQHEPDGRVLSAS